MKACATLNGLAGATLVAVLAFTACGGSGSSAQSPEPHASPSESDVEDVDGERGSAPREPVAASGGKQDSRTTAVIAEHVKRHRDEARACYDRIGEQKRLPAGDLVMAFRLSPDGTVKEASLNEGRSTLKDPDLVECVGDVIKGIQFPASSRGMETAVNYPFNFNPRGR